jgi:hypothetical protein
VITAFALLAALLQTTPAPAPAPAAVPVSTIEIPVQLLDSKGEVPRALQAGDLTVIDAGQQRPVAALSPLSRPWRIVVYVDRVLAGPGNDRVFVRDGRRDHVSCGSGDDTVTADRGDAIAASCEHVHRS